MRVNKYLYRKKLLKKNNKKYTYKESGAMQANH